jgi:hypothetical protein
MNKNVKKVADFLYREYENKAKDISIMRNPDGSYELYDKYVITENKISKKYLIQKRTTHLEKNFSSLKNAVTWCVFEKYNKINEMKRIEQLDETIEFMEASIIRYKSLIQKTKDQEYRLIYSAKLSIDEIKKAALVEELLGFISDAKLWQEKLFVKNAKNKTRMINI